LAQALAYAPALVAPLRQLPFWDLIVTDVNETA
jgi:hypothetical protein